MGFMAAMKHFFGTLPGQTAMQFGQEIKVLSIQERNWFFENLKLNGIECDPPIVFKTDPVPA